MQSADKAEKAKQLGVFDIIDDTVLTTLDRSTLEAWTNCPWQAKALEGQQTVMPEVAVIGELGHIAFSQATREWIETEGQMTTADLKRTLESALRGSRPDLQPQVIDSVIYSAWAWAQFVWAIHPLNLVRYDGGEGKRSGQLSIAFEDLNVIVTSEIDLLYSGTSPELLHEVDYKTGHKMFTAAMVRESFQFQLHAVLVFHNYLDVNGLEVVIWNTRRNDRTFKVVFKRDELADLTSRIRMAIQVRIQQYEAPETWPTLEKCGNCDVASRCPVATQAIRDITADPKAFVMDMVAVQARLTAMEKTAVALVDKQGEDIVADGVCFGRQKPKTERKSAPAIYEV